MHSEFRDLVAYQRSVAIAKRLRRAVGRWPSFHMWSIGIQLIRAADSVAANIAEAAGRTHKADKARFLVYAQASLYETEHWVATAEEEGLLPKGSTDELDGTARALSGLVKKWTSQ
jgi:four helix bundle protein